MKKFNSNIFSMEEQEVATNLLNSINLNSEKNQVTYFLTGLEQKILEKLVTLTSARVEFFGGLETSERKRAKIVFNDYYDVDYNIVVLQAKFNAKFQSIEHRNVLGALHKLGLNYNRFGDIVVQDEIIYLFVTKDIADYLVFNFKKIGRTNIEFQEVIEDDINIEQEYAEQVIVVSSLRVDNVVAKITHKSRSKVKEMLEKEFIKINHSIIRNGEKNCNEQDMLSIRKHGRFTLREINQNTKTLKYRVKVDKLI